MPEIPADEAWTAELEAARIDAYNRLLMVYAKEMQRARNDWLKDTLNNLLKSGVDLREVDVKEYHDNRTVVVHGDKTYQHVFIFTENGAPIYFRHK